MLTKHVTVKNRVANYAERDGVIVCGNSGYKIVFSFDAEWADKPTKYARFIWNGNYKNVPFTGNECPIPFIRNASCLEVGVCTGDPDNPATEDFWSTTTTIIPCSGSVIGVPAVRSH